MNQIVVHAYEVACDFYLHFNGSGDNLGTGFEFWVLYLTLLFYEGGCPSLMLAQYIRHELKGPKRVLSILATALYKVTCKFPKFLQLVLLNNFLFQKKNFPNTRLHRKTSRNSIKRKKETFERFNIPFPSFFCLLIDS